MRLCGAKRPTPLMERKNHGERRASSLVFKEYEGGHNDSRCSDAPLLGQGAPMVHLRTCVFGLKTGFTGRVH